MYSARACLGYHTIGILDDEDYHVVFKTKRVYLNAASDRVWRYERSSYKPRQPHAQQYIECVGAIEFEIQQICSSE